MAPKELARRAKLIRGILDLQLTTFYTMDSLARERTDVLQTTYTTEKRRYARDKSDWREEQERFDRMLPLWAHEEEPRRSEAAW